MGQARGDCAVCAAGRWHRRPARNAAVDDGIRNSRRGGDGRAGEDRFGAPLPDHRNRGQARSRVHWRLDQDQDGARQSGDRLAFWSEEVLRPGRTRRPVDVAVATCRRGAGQDRGRKSARRAGGDQAGEVRWAAQPAGARRRRRDFGRRLAAIGFLARRRQAERAAHAQGQRRRLRDRRRQPGGGVRAGAESVGFRDEGNRESQRRDDVGVQRPRL